MTLDELADQAVDAVLDEHRAEIEQLVERRVRNRLAELVRSLVGGKIVVELVGPAAPSNGQHEHHVRQRGDAGESSTPTPTPARRCATCGERLALAGRRSCATCKNRRQRQRAREAPSTAISRPDEPDADPAPVEHAGAPDDAAAGRRPPRQRTGGRLVSADDRQAERERRELIASVEPEVELDEHGRTWRVRRLPATYAPPAAGSTLVAAD